MKKHNVKVIVYGLFPTVYFMCSPCCTTDYFSACKLKYEEEQVREYPKGLVEHQEFLVKVLEELKGISGRLKFEIISADTLKGLLFSIKHSLGLEPAIIVEGKAFKGLNIDLKEVKEYVETLIRTTE